MGFHSITFCIFMLSNLAEAAYPCTHVTEREVKTLEPCDYKHYTHELPSQQVFHAYCHKSLYFFHMFFKTSFLKVTSIMAAWQWVSSVNTVISFLLWFCCYAVLIGTFCWHGFLSTYNRTEESLQINIKHLD